MAKEFLGEFEELVLTLVAALQEDAYGAAIAEEIETRMKRDVTLSAVHVTLYRLEDKGFLKSGLGGGAGTVGNRTNANSLGGMVGDQSQYSLVGPNPYNPYRY